MLSPITKHRYGTQIKAGRILLYFFMIALVLFTVLPLWFMVISSLKPLDELYIYPPRFYVRSPSLQNFTQLFKTMDMSTVPFSRYIFNSLITSVSAVFFSVIVCSMGAYSLSKIKMRGSIIVFNIIVAALMFSPQVTQIPSFIIVKNLGLFNNLLSLIIPKIAIAYNLFLLKQFADQIPDSLLESARVDGANEFSTYYKIVMPMLKPAWATVVVFSFMSNWNDYFTPLIFIQDQVLKTLPLALQQIGTSLQSGSNAVLATAGQVAAATFITTIPTILIFVLMQSRVIKTMAYSGIKA